MRIELDLQWGTICSIVYIIFFIISSLTLTALHADDKKQVDNKPVYYYGIMPIQKGQPIDEIRAIYKPLLTWLGAEAGCPYVSG